jgi:Phage integrase family
MPERHRALIVLAAGTGLRQGEAFGVDLAAINFLRRSLEIRQQLVTMPGKPPYLAPPKTPSSYRTLPLPQVVVEALAAHLATFPATRIEILDAAVKPEPKMRPATLVFTDAAGRPLRRTRFSDVWRPAAATAGLDDGVTFHDLRHYHASLLIRHGESVKAVQRRLGPQVGGGDARHVQPPLAGFRGSDSRGRRRGARPERQPRCGGSAVSACALIVPCSGLVGMLVQVDHVVQGEPACKPASVPRVDPGVAAIHLGPALPPASCGPPGDSAGPASTATMVAAGASPIRPCSGWGLPSRPVTRPLVRSYRTVSPLPPRWRGEAVCSLWHCPAGRPDWRLASTLPYGGRTFLDPGEPGPRPPSRLPLPGQYATRSGPGGGYGLLEECDHP